MSDLEKQIDAVYDKLVEGCPDPRAHTYREDFRAAEAEARERFDRWREESLEDRRRYHRLCGRDKKDADDLAQRDVGLLEIAVLEERDRLIASHWLRFTRRLSALLEELSASQGDEATG